MRSSKTLNKIRSGRPVRLCALGHFIPSYIALAAHFNYDCIWLDAEHRSFSEREIQAMLAYFHRFDIDCMLRAPTTEKTRLYRYLEDGASGLMIPHVSTPEQAQSLAASVKFPPLGERGLDGVGFDTGFVGSDDSYTFEANQETFLIVQIETPEAVRNVEEIAAVKGVDGLFVGPGDLGLRIRRENSELTLEEAFASVAAAAAKHGKAWGAPGASLDDVRRLHSQGAQMIAYGGDYMALLEMLKDRASELDEVYGANSD